MEPCSLSDQSVGSLTSSSYIKEFVHGDFGRTKPNLSQLLRTDTDILELDVEVKARLGAGGSRGASLTRVSWPSVGGRGLASCRTRVRGAGPAWTWVRTEPAHCSVGRASCSQ